MPQFRGIDICVAVSQKDGLLKEYSHPDSFSVHLKKAGSDDIENDVSANSDSTRQKVNPRVSVYIPSLPGEQFWLRYAVTQVPPPSKYLYFKAFMNGHQITSWGINTCRQPQGNLSRALYKPGRRWRDMYGDIDTSFVGIEARHFNFLPGLDKLSAAEDGGMIEVQVYRANGQRRIAPELDEYHSQERYGIGSPSGGLIDNPQDATYFQYSLIDPKDCPYCTFRFHYRSLKYLRQLNLIPEEEPSIFMPPKRHPFARKPTANQDPENVSPSLQHFAFDIEPLRTRTHKENAKGDHKLDSLSNAESSNIPTAEEDDILVQPLKLPTGTPSTGPVPEPYKSVGTQIMNDILQRPLPNLPMTRSRQSSTSSVRSNCPSLTPSVMQYVDGDDFDQEEIELHTARPVVISPTSMQAQAQEPENENDSKGSIFSISDYANSPDSTMASRAEDCPSPDDYLPTTGSILERHLEDPESPIAHSSPKRIKAKIRVFTQEDAHSEDEDPAEIGTMELTEAKWLRHVPSPLRRKTGRVQRLWSPRPDKRESDSSSIYSIHSETTLKADPGNDISSSEASKAPAVSANRATSPPKGNWI